jgi:hypothetical protein
LREVTHKDTFAVGRKDRRRAKNVSSSTLDSNTFRVNSNKEMKLTVPSAMLIVATATFVNRFTKATAYASSARNFSVAAFANLKSTPTVGGNLRIRPAFHRRYVTSHGMSSSENDEYDFDYLV